MDILCITSVVRLQCIPVTCATVVLTRLSMKKKGGARLSCGLRKFSTHFILKDLFVAVK